MDKTNIIIPTKSFAETHNRSQITFTCQNHIYSKSHTDSLGESFSQIHIYFSKTHLLAEITFLQTPFTQKQTNLTQSQTESHLLHKYLLIKVTFTE